MKNSKKRRTDREKEETKAKEIEELKDEGAEQDKYIAKLMNEIDNFKARLGESDKNADTLHKLYRMGLIDENVYPMNQEERI